MEVIGKIIQVLPLQSGKSAAGRDWKKQEYVLETLESFPRKICFSFFGDRVDQFPLQPNQTIKLSFDIESREYNGKWFTNINGWKVEPADGNMGAMNPPANYQQPAPGAFPTGPQGYAPAVPAYQQPAAPAYQQPAAPAYQQPAAPMGGGFPTPPAAEPANDDLPF